METPPEHLHYLRRQDFAPGAASNYTTEELAVLRRYGHWMQALTSGEIAPISTDQEHFLRVNSGSETAVTIYEHAWSKYKRLKAGDTSQERPKGRVVAEDPPPDSTRDADDEAVRNLRALVARGHVLSSFADSLLRQLEEGKALTRKQLDAVHRLVQRADARERNREARVVTGQSRKRGSHRGRG